MFKIGYEYFRNNLPTTKENNMYERIYQAILNREEQLYFDYREISTSRVRELLAYVYEDHPGLFYYAPYKTQIYSNPNNARIKFVYLYDEETTQAYENKIKQIMMHFFDTYHVLSLPKYNRILILHNLISSICTYDPIVSSHQGNGADEDYNIIGVFSGRLAVCYGFSLAFKLLCDYANIPCLVVVGTAKGRHAWNMVEYRGHYYHIDCTWDLKESNESLGIYKYFMVNDEWIQKTRTIDEAACYPLCDNLDFTFYDVFQSKISYINELSEFLKQKLLEQATHIYCLVENGNLNRNLIQRALVEAYRKYEIQTQKKISFYYDYNYDTRYNLIYFTRR